MIHSISVVTKGDNDAEKAQYLNKHRNSDEKKPLYKSGFLTRFKNQTPQQGFDFKLKSFFLQLKKEKRA